MILIKLRDIGVRFRNNIVLNQVSYEFETGRCYHISGVNGSGKSVLFKAICGFVPLSSGEVILDPSLYLSKRKYPLDFGVIIDRPSFISDLSGYDNLLFLSRFRNVVSPAEISSLMSEYGLSSLDKRPVSKYSLGMKQKLSLCQAFMEKPRVLLLDEAFNALDAESRTILFSKIREFVDNGGLVILTSHHASDYDSLDPIRLEIVEHSLQPLLTSD